MPSSGVVVAGCWRSRRTVTLFADGVGRDDPEAIEAIQKARAAYRLERAIVAAETAKKASDMLGWSRPLDASHRYLVRKGIDRMPFVSGRLRAVSFKSSIALDLGNIEGELVGLQLISPDGDKKFLSGTAKKGAWHWLLALSKDIRRDEIIAVVEGWATGCAVAQLYGICRVAVAFDAGNIEHVVKKLLLLFPSNKIIVFADDDDVNPATGKAAGKVAAESARRLDPSRVGVQYPMWSGGVKPAGASDFNDLFCLDND
jgi:putative DNA primase/helicase